MVSGIKRHSGLFMIITGWIHTILGFIVFYEIIMDMIGAGLFNSINMQYDRNSMFWFIFTGWLLILTGHLINWLIKQKNILLPSWFGWYLLLFSVIGIIVMPLSGFWLVVPQAWILIVAAQK